MIDTLLRAALPKVRVETIRQQHPYGSTTATEELVDVTLAEPFVVVRVDADDLLPVEREGMILVDDVEVRLRFSMPQVGLRDGNRVVTYQVEVVDG